MGVFGLHLKLMIWSPNKIMLFCLQNIWCAFKGCCFSGFCNLFPFHECGCNIQKWMCQEDVKCLEHDLFSRHIYRIVLIRIVQNHWQNHVVKVQTRLIVTLHVRFLPNFKWGTETQHVRKVWQCNRVINFTIFVCVDVVSFFQERLIKKLGPNAYPFYFELPPHCPASVTLQPAPGDTGKPCGVDYELKAFVGETLDDKPHKRWVFFLLQIIFV